MTSHDAIARKTDKVKSADRALEVMECLVHAPMGLSHSDLAAELKIPKSSLTKILGSLMSCGYIERVDGAIYLVGPRWRAMVKASISSRSLDEIVVGSLERLMRDTGETAGFGMVVNGQIEIVSTVVSPQQLQYTMSRGDRAPMHAMSSGLAILAFLDGETQQIYFQEVAKCDAQSPLRKAVAFTRAMRTIADQGFAEVRSFREGIVGLAVPILGSERPLGALNIAAPEIRFSDALRDRAVASMHHLARQLGDQLGGWIEPEPLNLR